MAGWTAIALSRDVPAGTTRAVILDGRELVLWRDADGAVHVWEDRCPHRGMRFSFGFVRGNTLNCLYHGWQYGSGASCERIPAHPDLTVPRTIRATAFPVMEVGGLIWTGEGQMPAVPDGMKPLASFALLASAERVPREVDTPAGAGYLATHAMSPGKTMVHALLAADADGEAAWWWLKERRTEWEAA